ncbi:MAG: glutamate--tRNA ligase [Bacteriovoracaceae bacterium]|nr:glutamate--tRNA ligase [Bacteriovoracaceae bacterium]
MSVRVRFAPSPTGYLHIGGARTALYNYIFSKAMGGTYVLRIEDTDVARSTKESEEMVLKDLQWLGIDHDEGPDKPGKFGPYRQSERTELYQKFADQLIDSEKAFYCFCSQEELEAKKAKAEAENADPTYDGTCHSISTEEAKKRMANGEEAVIRFKAPKKDYTFVDKVRGEITFPNGMIGDFVVMRSNGLPVYNFCCVIDDWQMEITHVIRAEDHLPNTLRQLMIYEAFDATPPVFGHVSLLVGHDRKKLSKRHGTTAVGLYREDGYLADALNNYLCLLGWSHPDETDIFTPSEILSVFDMNRFNKSAATFDMAKLGWVNGEYIRKFDTDALVAAVSSAIPEGALFFDQTPEWKAKACELYKEKCNFFKDFNPFIDSLFLESIAADEALEDIFSWESTPAIKDYLAGKIGEMVDSGIEYATEEHFGEWSTHIKKELKIKGKFLFMGMRGVLTRQAHGSDLKTTATLTPLKVFSARLR